MSLGPNIVRNGLVFHYDLSDGKSFAGEPTTNYIHHQNPRIDGTYTPFIPYDGTGNMTVNHPQGIRVYNQNGDDISWYVNTGISVANSGVAWENARHAYWIYDNDLKKPVVQSYDAIGTWQAKAFGTGMDAWSTYGMTVGSQYTISWLQWTTNLTKRAHVGLYTRDSGGNYNFWDGLSTAPVNTKTHTWERLSQTYTVSASRDLNDSYSAVYCYMHVFTSGEYIRVADVQLELKDHATAFSPTLTRSSTQSLFDRTRNSTINVSNTSFDSNGKMYFDGTNDSIVVSDAPHLRFPNGPFSVEVVLNISSISGKQRIVSKGSSGWSRGWHIAARPTQWELELSDGISTPGNSFLINTTTTVGLNHIVWVITPTTAKLYVNGTQFGSTQTITESWDFATGTSNLGIGAFESGGEYLNGYIHNVRIYNTELSSTNVLNNFTAIRSKYGL